MSAPIQFARPEQQLLPFAEREWVDVRRMESILGVGHTTVYRLRAARDERGELLLDVMDYGHGRRQRVLYASIVRYCDWLRRRYGIPDRRPPLDNPLFRHKDADLLPFPLRDSIGIAQARSALAYESKDPVIALIEEGAFEAYRLLEDGSSPWRISRPSFSAWLESSRNRNR